MAVVVVVVVFVVVFASVGCGSGGKVASLISAASNINQSSEKISSVDCKCVNNKKLKSEQKIAYKKALKTNSFQIRKTAHEV